MIVQESGARFRVLSTVRLGGYNVKKRICTKRKCITLKPELASLSPFLVQYVRSPSILHADSLRCVTSDSVLE